MHNPLSALIQFFRTQLSGAPEQHVHNAVKGIEDHVGAEVEAVEARLRAAFENRLAAIETALGLTPSAGAPASPSTGSNDPLPPGSPAQPTA